MYLPTSVDSLVNIARRQTSNPSFTNNHYEMQRTGMRVVGIGAIVGIVIGVISLLVICCLACFCVRRSRQRRRNMATPSTYDHQKENRFSQSTAATNEPPPAYGPAYNGSPYDPTKMSAPQPAHTAGHHTAGHHPGL